MEEAKDILQHVGGASNIAELDQDASSIYIRVKNIQAVNLHAMKSIEYVYAVRFKGETLLILLSKKKLLEVYDFIQMEAAQQAGKKERGNGMNQFFSKFQMFGKSIMLPIAVLPAAGLLLGIGGAFSNPNTIASYPFLDNFILQAIFTIMSAAGNIIFSNLPIIFAVGIAVGLARSDKGVAGLAAVLAYLVMNASLNAMLSINGELAEGNLASLGQGMILGIQTLQTGVFGGVIVGIMTYMLHNRFSKVQLPQFLGFFSGSRFIPIITSVTAVLLGIVMYLVWPPLQSGIASLGGLVDKTGYFGTFLFGFIVKLLGPLGLHHVFYLPFWQTGLGGTMEVAGNVVQGAQNIFFAQLSDPNTEQYYIGTARFMSGKYFPMMFGLLGAALAIYQTAKPENKKKVLGLMGTGALTSFLTGITEPLEFAFLFVAPVLFAVHAALWGLAYMLAHIFEVTIGMTFSAGLIDFLLFGVLQGNDKTNWILVPIIGIFFFLAYYLIFKVLIVKMNLKTPGREDEEETGAENNEAAGNAESADRPRTILAALGGEANISELDNCATRLRVTVINPDQVSEADLKKSGAKGVIVRGNGVQAIYGPHVSIIKTEIEEITDL